jgi:hypothetical protein
MTQPKWVLEPDAAEHLSISTVTLRLMRREGRLTPGKDWLYLSGSKGGPVGYDLGAVTQTLAERTAELVATENKRSTKARKERTAAVESFAGAH